MLLFLEPVLQGGLKGSLVLFFTVLSYKMYKMRISSESSCFNGCLKLHTYNNGDGPTEGIAV